MTLIPRLAEIVWSSIKLWLFLRHKYHEMSTFFETIMKYNRILAMSILTLVAMTMSTSSSIPSSQETTIYPATWTETMRSRSGKRGKWRRSTSARRVSPLYMASSISGTWLLWNATATGWPAWTSARIPYLLGWIVMTISWQRWM